MKPGWGILTIGGVLTGVGVLGIWLVIGKGLDRPGNPVSPADRPRDRSDHAKVTDPRIAAQHEARHQMLSRSYVWQGLMDSGRYDTDECRALEKDLKKRGFRDVLASLAGRGDDLTENLMAKLFYEWAKADPTDAVMALNGLSGFRQQDAAIRGYSSLLIEKSGPEAGVAARRTLGALKDPRMAADFYKNLSFGWMINGNVPVTDLTKWGSEMESGRRDFGHGQAAFLMGQSLAVIDDMKANRLLATGQIERIFKDNLRALDMLGSPQRPEQANLAFYADAIGKLAVSDPGQPAPVATYQAPGTPELIEPFMRGVGSALYASVPADIIASLKPREGEIGPRELALWTGYLGKWSGNKSTYALLTELSAVEGPEALQRTTARCILAERLKTNSVAATQAINSLPPGKTKDLYRAEVADWLERQGLVEDAKAWRP